VRSQCSAPMVSAISALIRIFFDVGALIFTIGSSF
jgi:hypothetical protein